MPSALPIPILLVALASLGAQDVPTAAPPTRTRVVIDAPRASVWVAWSTSAGLATFLAPDARIELRCGGAMEIHLDPTADEGLRGSEGCEVLSWIDGEMLSFSWSAPPTLGHLRSRRHFVVVRLSDGPDEGSTTVEITDGGYTREVGDARIQSYFKDAWPYVLQNLQKRFRDGPLWPGAASECPARPLDPWLITMALTHPETATAPTDEEIEILRQHREYLDGLVDRARVVVSGTCVDSGFPPRGELASALALPDAFAVLVVRAHDAEDARRLLDQDPAVAAGLFHARIQSLRASFPR